MCSALHLLQAVSPSGGSGFRTRLHLSTAAAFSQAEECNLLQTDTGRRSEQPHSSCEPGSPAAFCCSFQLLCPNKLNLEKPAIENRASPSAFHLI